MRCLLCLACDLLIAMIVLSFIGIVQSSGFPHCVSAKDGSPVDPNLADGRFSSHLAERKSHAGSREQEVSIVAVSLL